MATAERIPSDDLNVMLLLSRADVRVLRPEEEREILMELHGLRSQLAAAAGELHPDAEFDVQEFVRFVLAGGSPQSDEELVLQATARSYNATRTRLAMANLRLVAHVARRYRDRGMAVSDLLQEGFCGLLTAIDRYDVSNTTRLASYAVWWIRQALQRAVAAGVYPVRLNPRHLQKLAESSHADEGDQAPKRARSASAETTLKQLHAATRPVVSLDAPMGDSGRSSILDMLSVSDEDEVEDRDHEEQLAGLINQLKPREKLVLRLRYGLDGSPAHSLSQVSQVLGVSKERIRQIQDAALTKLRALAGSREFCEVG